MRLAERLTRIELARSSAGPRMSGTEIDAAEVDYAARLASCRHADAPSVTAWRGLVERSTAPFQQVWARALPVDFLL